MTEDEVAALSVQVIESLDGEPWATELALVQAAIRAAVPAIERQVGEKIAAAIEADIVYADDGSLNAFAMGEQHAARIARGGLR